MLFLMIKVQIVSGGVQSIICLRILAHFSSFCLYLKIHSTGPMYVLYREFSFEPIITS